MLEQGQSVSSPAAEEKGEAETTCDELTTAGAGEDIEKSYGVKEWSWAWDKGRVGGKVFYFLTALLWFDKQQTKLISPSQVYFAYESNWRVT